MESLKRAFLYLRANKKNKIIFCIIIILACVIALAYGWTARNERLRQEAQSTVSNPDALKANIDGYFYGGSIGEYLKFYDPNLWNTLLTLQEDYSDDEEFTSENLDTFVSQSKYFINNNENLFYKKLRKFLDSV